VGQRKSHPARAGHPRDAASLVTTHVQHPVGYHAVPLHLGPADRHLHTQRRYRSRVDDRPTQHLPLLWQYGGPAAPHEGRGVTEDQVVSHATNALAGQALSKKRKAAIGPCCSAACRLSDRRGDIRCWELYDGSSAGSAVTTKAAPRLPAISVFPLVTHLLGPGQPRRHPAPPVPGDRGANRSGRGDRPDQGGGIVQCGRQ
jgi:hypothetical protein